MLSKAFLGCYEYDSVQGMLKTDEQARAAVLLAFRDPFPDDSCAVLWNLSDAQWLRLLKWLDTSGLALYFLDRVLDLKRSESLPPNVLRRLQQNLFDNTERATGMIAESTAIHREFQSVGISYATLKGFSLWPSSVPDPCLRSQLDLDFLVAESSAAVAQQILESRGYYLHATSGRSWEFKTRHMPGNSLRDLYKALPFRCVELHLERTSEIRPSLLQRKTEIEFHGIRMPVLRAADLFVGQGLHLAKHVCSEFFRASHLIEFWRHIVFRRNDEDFWKEVRAVAEQSPAAPSALGMVVLLITLVMGDCAPSAFTCWTVDSLPASTRLWVELYGRRAALGDFPGSKLYVLLQRELGMAGALPKRELRRALLPMKLPPALSRGTSSESVMGRVHRYRQHARLILFRLRFHAVEGIRYTYESFLWRRRKNRLA